MKQKQLRLLLSAGIFSAALLNGAAYADDANSQPAPTAPTDSAAKTSPVPAAKKTSDAFASDKPAVKQAISHPTPSEQSCGGKNGCGSSGSDSKSAH